jgi:hypothetical protein
VPRAVEADEIPLGLPPCNWGAHLNAAGQLSPIAEILRSPPANFAILLRSVRDYFQISLADLGPGSLAIYLSCLARLKKVANLLAHLSISRQLI